jgi:hypothetical protein
MPAEHTVDHDFKLIVTTWSGEAHDEDLIEALAKYHREIRSHYYAYDEILDLTGVSRYRLSTSGIRRLAHMSVDADVQGVKTRLAIVVSSSLAYGLGRMYVAYRDLVPGGVKEVNIFKDYGEAQEWIVNYAGS